MFVNVQKKLLGNIQCSIFIKTINIYVKTSYLFHPFLSPSICSGTSATVPSSHVRLQRENCRGSAGGSGSILQNLRERRDGWGGGEALLPPPPPY